MVYTMTHNVQPLICFCEENFDCQDGYPYAYMEFPVPGFGRGPDGPGDIVRVSYEVYAIRAKSFKAAEAWMIDNVLMPFVKEAGPNPKLYWRKKFVVERFKKSDPERLVLRGRFGVLNRNYEQVTIKDAVYTSDHWYPVLDPRLDEGGMYCVE